MAHLGARTGRQHQRHHTHDEGQAGHDDGTQAQTAGLDGRLQRRAPLLLQVHRKLDDEDGVLARQAHQHDEADLSEDVVVAAGEPHAHQRRHDAHGHNQDNGQRQGPAFVLRGQHQKRQQHAQREDVSRTAARQDLLVRQLGPFKRHTRWQRLACQLAHGIERRRRTGTRQRLTVDVCRQVTVVVADRVGADAIAHAHHRTQRHHATGGIARLEVQDLLFARTERRIGLGDDLIAAAEQVHIVDVQRTQVHLQCFKHIAQRHVVALGTHAVDVGIDLRHVHTIVREHAHHARRLVGRGHKLLQHLIEPAIAQRTAVFDLHLEAAQRAHAVDRRRHHHTNKSLVYCEQLHLQTLCDGTGRQRLALALGLRIERGKDDAAVRSDAKACGHRHTRERDDGLDALLGRHDVGHAPHHGFGALYGRRIGQLCKSDDIVFVLHRHKALGHAHKAQRTQTQQQRINHQRQRGHAQHPCHAAAIAFRRPDKKAIERPEDEATDRLQHTRAHVGLAAMRLEQHGRQCRRQR